MGIKMCNLNRLTVSSLIAEKKAEVLRSPTKRSHRCNFNNELKKLSTLLNWYSRNFDLTYTNPISELHKAEGFLRKIKPVKKKMTALEVLRFFDSMKELSNGQFWSDLAETQLFLSARIGEIGGLQWESIDFQAGTIEVSHVAVYLKKRFYALKDHTKNGESRIVLMNKRLQEILARRFKLKEADCNFVFHIGGLPPSKQRIDNNYNKAFRSPKLSFSGTHCLRHTMANLVRSQLSLEHAKALGGWKSSKVVELIYTDTPTKLKQESVDCIENLLLLEQSKRNCGK
jgi:integrase